MLPPTRATLLPHILRANYITMLDKSYQTSCPDLPPIEANGWNAEKGLYIPVRCLALPAPQAVIELIKCSCKQVAGADAVAPKMVCLAHLCVNATAETARIR